MSPSEADEPDGEPRADGGAVDTELFTHTSNVGAPTRSERLRRDVELMVFSPMRVAWKDIRMRIGATLIFFFAVVGVIGELSRSSLAGPLQSFALSIPGVGSIHPFAMFIVQKPLPYDGALLASPLASGYLLGTNNLGQPIGKMLIHATPDMWKMVITGAIFSVIIGTLIGTVAGYLGGAVDRALMTLTDMVLTIPGLALIIVLVSVYPPKSPYIVGLLLGIDNWPGLARTLRSEVLSLREETFTEASRVTDLSKITILRKDVISNLMPMISVNLAGSARSIIFESVGLYFLGILPFTSFNWGVMMNSAYQSGTFPETKMLHWLFIPMITIVLFSLGFLLFAQGLDRVFNVRLRARHTEFAADDDDGESEVPDTNTDHLV